jgi:hypothetical protein
MTAKEIAAKTAETIKKDAAIRAQYGYIRKAVNVDEAGVERVAYFREPNRLVVGIAMAEIDRNTLLACEYIFDDAVIREVSDVEYFRNNNGVFIGLSNMLQGLIQVKKSTFTA